LFAVRSRIHGSIGVDPLIQYQERRPMLAQRQLSPSVSSKAVSLVSAAIFVAAVTVFAVPASANDLIVKYDQSQLLRLPRPAAEIIIGNPTIADVSIQAGNLLVITGKSFGLTNIIALDHDRNVIQDQRVMVQRDEMRVVNLHKAGKRETYNCSPQCNPTVTVGDEQKYFDEISKNSERKIKLSEGNADGGGGGGGGGAGGGQ
jgi:hypothetical protein